MPRQNRRARGRKRGCEELSEAELHSSAELQCIGAVRAVLSGPSLTEADIVTSLKRGNALILSDACFDDPLVPGGACVFEYDEGYWHRRRVRADIDKSLAQLAAPGVTRLVRLRRGVDAIADRVADSRYCEVLTESQDPVVQAGAVLRALGLPFDAAHARRGAGLGLQAHLELDAMRKHNFSAMKAQLGAALANRIVRTVNGVQMRLFDAQFLVDMLAFREVVGARRMKTAFCDGVASKLGVSAAKTEQFLADVRALGELVPDGTLHTVLKGGTASKLGVSAAKTEQFLADVRALGELVPDGTLHTVLKGGAASKLGVSPAKTEQFLADVRALDKEVPDGTLHSVLKDGTASKLGVSAAKTEQFLEDVRALGKEVPDGTLHTVLKDGTASKLGVSAAKTEQFLADVRALGELVPDALVRLLATDQIVARLRNVVQRLEREPADARRALALRIHRAAKRRVAELTALLH